MTDSGNQLSIPKDFAAKLKQARARRSMQGERRIITALFCDVAGSTAMAEQLDPEDWGEIMDDAFDFLIAPVYRYEGTVARLMGDAILAFFGAPISHENDPERAVLAGMEMVANIKPFSDHVLLEYGMDFNVRVGINTGPVVVGEIGSDLALEYTAMGDAVNLAARMEQTAVPGTVQVSRNTYKLVAPLFDFKSLGQIQLKGKSDPVEAFQLLGRKSKPGRLRGLEGISAPLIGRGTEITQLRKAVSETQQGNGQIVCLIGEAGIGKSRLIEELKSDWPDEVSWAEIQGVSYDTMRPYGPFLQLLRQECGIDELDSPQAVRQKLNTMMETEKLEWQDKTVFAVQMLLAVNQAGDEISSSAGRRLEAEALKRELHDAFLDLWQRAADISPTVMVFDDLHWSDDASVELLLHLCQTVEDLPVMFLCAFRPYQTSPAWQLKQTLSSKYPGRYIEISLDPLSGEKSDALVGALLSIADLPAQLRQTILHKTEGNPFFIEEVVRSLIDDQAIVRDQNGLHWRAGIEVDEITIPDNVQALLMARIDRLEKEIRRTLQLAAVIGRSFYYRVLEMISDMTAVLGEQLDTLQRVELIYLASSAPELEYMFRHELARDAAYNSILHRRRRQFHQRVGQALEALFPNRLAEEAPRLAYHFREAGDEKRAMKYYSMAADAAAAIYANAEAETHYSLALELARKLSVGSERLVNLYTKRGRVLEVSGKYDRALANYRELQDLALERQDEALELAALIPQGTIYSTPTAKQDTERARALSARSLALSRALNDRRAEAKVLWNMMLLETYLGNDYRPAVEYGEQSIAIARQQNLRQELAYALHDIVRPYAAVGQFELAEKAAEEARELWQELGNLPMLADNLNLNASGYFQRGSFDKAFSLSQKSMDISRSIGSYWGQAYSLYTTGPIHIERGEVDKGIKVLSQGLILAEEANFVAPQVMQPIYLAWIYGSLGDLNQGFKHAHLAMAKTDEFGRFRGGAMAALARLYQYEGDLSKARTVLEEAYTAVESAGIYELAISLFVNSAAEILMASKEYHRVLDLVEKSITQMRSFGIRLYLSDLFYARSRALAGLGQNAEARQVLAEAYSEAKELGSRRSLLSILPAWIEAEEQTGNIELVGTLRVELRELISFIDGHIEEANLRSSFRALPAVMALRQS